MIYIVGAGPVSYALIHSLRANGCNDKIIVFSGKKQANLVEIVWKNSVSPKFLQKSLIDSIDHSSFQDKSFFHLNTLGVGGGARFWGASIASFNKADIDKNNLNYTNYQSSIKSVYKLLAGYNTNVNPLSAFINNDLLNSFRKSQYFFQFKKLELAVDGSKCVGCGRCITGCNYGAIWSPDYENFRKLDVEILDLYIEEIEYKSNFVKNLVSHARTVEVQNKDFVFLAVNPASAFQLLSPLSIIKKANFGACPSFAFAVPKINFFRRHNLFGMGVHTFESFISDDSKFFGNLYDGAVLANQKGHIFSNGNRILNFFKKFSLKFFVLGAGFIDSSNVKIQISIVSKKINFEVLSDVSDRLVNDLKCYIRSSSTLSFLTVIRRGVLGADLHYCDGVPSDIDVNGSNGSVNEVNNLKVVGSPNFKFLPAASPTLSFMANAYSIGEQHANNR